MIRLDNATFVYEPYPIAMIKPALDRNVYDEMLKAWPTPETYRTLGRKGQLKHYLNETKTRDDYHAFINAHPVWREFYAYVKSRQFIDSVLKLLRDNNLDLGFPQAKLPLKRRVRTALGDFIKRKRLPEFPQDVYTRFEFSMLPNKDGAILPHTDDPKKISTMVLYMPKEGEWDPAWGGGLEVCMPKDPRDRFNYVNRKLPFDAVENVHTYAYEPNQALLFVKTSSSWHQVSPIKGDGTGPLRRTVTIVFETN